MAITLDRLDSAFASIEIKDASGQALAIDGSGFLTTNINGTVAISATDLDIRDLDSAQDNVEIQNAAGQALAIDGSGFLTVNGNGTFTVSATDLDIRDLAFATDSVTAHQGGVWSFTIDNVSTWENTVETPGTTAAEIVATPLANRCKMIIQNTGNQDAYIGPDNTVTDANGLCIPKGSSAELPFDVTADIWAITGASTTTLRVSEFAA
jgi:hypothetical protein